jgi:FtsP/CotA-like multicopper oxidase with cupredoxin domain
MIGRKAPRLTRGILGALILALAATCALAQGVCPRFASGSTVTQPEDLFSQSGVLTVSFTYQTFVDENGLTRYCYVNSDGQQSPTLHVNPGDTIAMTVTNDVPAGAAMPPMQMAESVTPSKVCGDATMTATSVNVHFHGMNVLPVCHQDEVIHTLINSGSTFTYNLHIPPGQPPGLYWYHPHVHGIADASVLGGASGAIIVEGIQNIDPILEGMTEQILLIRDNLLPSQGSSVGPVPSRDVSLNYIPVPYPTYTPAVITMPAGQQQFWRVVNSSADTIINLEVLYDGQPQTLVVVELDGVPLASQGGNRTISESQILLPPAGRAEFIITGPSSTVKQAQLVTLGVTTGTNGFIDPQRPLATIQSTPAKAGASESKVPRVSGHAPAPRFAGLAAATPTLQRELHFSEDEQGYYITVNGHIPRVYSSDLPPAITTTQGSIEDWTIQNQATEAHEFHIHQLHFLLMQRNGQAVPLNQQQMLDTIHIPGWIGHGAYPSVTVRLDFRGPDVGEFVYHCHILDHEDKGMMAILQVLPPTLAKGTVGVPAAAELASGATNDSKAEEPSVMEKAHSPSLR